MKSGSTARPDLELGRCLTFAWNFHQDYNWSRRQLSTGDQQPTTQQTDRWDNFAVASSWMNSSDGTIEWLSNNCNDNDNKRHQDKRFVDGYTSNEIIGTETTARDYHWIISTPVLKVFAIWLSIVTVVCRSTLEWIQWQILQKLLKQYWQPKRSAVASASWVLLLHARQLEALMWSHSRRTTHDGSFGGEGGTVRRGGGECRFREPFKYETNNYLRDSNGAMELRLEKHK